MTELGASPQMQVRRGVPKKHALHFQLSFLRSGDRHDEFHGFDQRVADAGVLPLGNSVTGESQKSVDHLEGAQGVEINGLSSALLDQKILFRVHSLAPFYASRNAHSRLRHTGIQLPHGNRIRWPGKYQSLPLTPENELGARPSSQRTKNHRRHNQHRHCDQRSAPNAVKSHGTYL